MNALTGGALESWLLTQQYFSVVKVTLSILYKRAEPANIIRDLVSRMNITEEGSQKLDQEQKIQVVHIMNILISIGLKQILDNRLDKFRSTYAKIESLLDILPRIEGDIVRIDLELKTTIVEAMSMRDRPFDMISRLQRNSKEYFAKGISLYSLTIYHLLLAVCYLQTSNTSSFYNRVKTIKQLISQSLKYKLSSNKLDLGVSIAIKTIDGDPSIFKHLVAVACLFDWAADLVSKTANEHSLLVKQNAVSLVEHSKDESFEAAMQTFLKHLEKFERRQLKEKQLKLLQQQEASSKSKEVVTSRSTQPSTARTYSINIQDYDRSRRGRRSQNFSRNNVFAGNQNLTDKSTKAGFVEGNLFVPSISKEVANEMTVSAVLARKTLTNRNVEEGSVGGNMELPIGVLPIDPISQEAIKREMDLLEKSGTKTAVQTLKSALKSYSLESTLHRLQANELHSTEEPRYMQFSRDRKNIGSVWVHDLFRGQKASEADVRSRPQSSNRHRSVKSGSETTRGVFQVKKSWYGSTNIQDHAKEGYVIPKSAYHNPGLDIRKYGNIKNFSYMLKESSGKLKQQSTVKEGRTEAKSVLEVTKDHLKNNLMIFSTRNEDLLNMPDMSIIHSLHEKSPDETMVVDTLQVPVTRRQGSSPDLGNLSMDKKKPKPTLKVFRDPELKKAVEKEFSQVAGRMFSHFGVSSSDMLILKRPPDNPVKGAMGNLAKHADPPQDEPSDAYRRYILQNTKLSNTYSVTDRDTFTERRKTVKDRSGQGIIVKKKHKRHLNTTEKALVLQDESTHKINKSISRNSQKARPAEGIPSEKEGIRSLEHSTRNSRRASKLPFPLPHDELNFITNQTSPEAEITDNKLQIPRDNTAQELGTSKGNVHSRTKPLRSMSIRNDASMIIQKQTRTAMAKRHTEKLKIGQIPDDNSPSAPSKYVGLKTKPLRTLTKKSDESPTNRERASISSHRKSKKLDKEEPAQLLEPATRTNRERRKSIVNFVKTASPLISVFRGVQQRRASKTPSVRLSFRDNKEHKVVGSKDASEEDTDKFSPIIRRDGKSVFGFKKNSPDESRLEDILDDSPSPSPLKQKQSKKSNTSMVKANDIARVEYTEDSPERRNTNFVLGDHFIIPRFELLKFVRAFEILFKFMNARSSHAKRIGFFIIRFMPEFSNLKKLTSKIEFHRSALELDADLNVDNGAELRYKPWRRRFSEKFERIKIDQMFPKMQFRRNTYTYFLTKCRNQLQNCRRTAIRILPSRLPENSPIQVCFQRRTKVDLITIYLDNRMRHQIFSHKGVGAWLNLTNYLKKYIDHIDLEKLNRVHIDSGRHIRPSTIIEEKNKIMTSMFILLLSEKSVLIPNIMGGLFITFVDNNLMPVRYAVDSMISTLHRGRDQALKNILHVERDKAYEIYLSQNVQWDRQDFEVLDMKKQLENGLYFESDQESQSSSVVSHKEKYVISVNKLHIQEDDDLAQASVLTSPVLKGPSKNYFGDKLQVISFDELVTLLEDERTSLKSLFLIRRQTNGLAVQKGEVKKQRLGHVTKIDNRLFTVTRKVGTRFLIIQACLDLNTLMPCSIMPIGDKIIPFVSSIGIVWRAEVSNTKSRDLMREQTIIRSLTFEDLFKLTGQPTKGLAVGLRNFIMSSSMSPFYRAKLIELVQPLLIANIRGITISGFGKVLEIMKGASPKIRWKQGISLQSNTFSEMHKFAQGTASHRSNVAGIGYAFQVVFNRVALWMIRLYRQANTGPSPTKIQGKLCLMQEYRLRDSNLSLTLLTLSSTPHSTNCITLQ